MSRIYDSWERLVAAVLKREEFRRLCYCDSIESSISSTPSDISPGSSSRFDERVASEFGPGSTSRHDERTEQYEPGIYITFAILRDGTTKIKGVHFSKSIFNKQQIYIWWLNNRQKVIKKYEPASLRSGTVPSGFVLWPMVQPRNFNKSEEIKVVEGLHDLASYSIAKFSCARTTLKDNNKVEGSEIQGIANQLGDQSRQVVNRSQFSMCNSREFKKQGAMSSTSNQVPLSMETQVPSGMEEQIPIKSDKHKINSNSNELLVVQGRNKEPISETKILEWTEQYKPGIYITFAIVRGHGTTEIKGVHFSKSIFSEQQIYIWWLNNREKVLKKYEPASLRSGTVPSGLVLLPKVPLHIFNNSEEIKVVEGPHDLASYGIEFSLSIITLEDKNKAEGFEIQGIANQIADQSRQVVNRSQFSRKFKKQGARSSTSNQVPLSMEEQVPSGTEEQIPTNSDKNKINGNSNELLVVQGRNKEPISETKRSEWVEQYEDGVYLTLVQDENGLKDLKRVRFSKKKFCSNDEVEAWWIKNRENVYNRYNIRSEGSKTNNSPTEVSVAQGRNEEPIVETNFQ